MLASAAYAHCGILVKVCTKDTIEIRGVQLEIMGSVKEFLRGYGEELGLVSGAVGIEEGFVPFLGKEAQPLKFLGTHRYPFGELIAVSEGRGAVCGSVEHVEFVGEFMVDDIMPLLGMARIMPDSVPYQNHWAQGKRLPQDRSRCFYRPANMFEDPGAMLGGDYG